MPIAERTAVRTVLNRAGLLNAAMHAGASDECTEGSNDRAVAAEIVPAELKRCRWTNRGRNENWQ